MFKIFKIFELVYYKFFLTPNDVAKKIGVKFGNNCIFRTKLFGSEPYLIEVGNNVATSSGVQFVTHDGSLHVLRNMYTELENIDLFGKIVLKNNIFIGINSIILQNTLIEDNVIIGAGSIVKGHLKSNSVYAGTPVKFICTIEEYKKKNSNSFDYTKRFSQIEKKEFLLNKFKKGE